MEYDDLLPRASERGRLKRGARSEAYFKRPVISSYIKDSQAHETKKRDGRHVCQRKHFLKNVCIQVKKRQNAQKKKKEAWKERGKLEPSELKSIFRKMFICGSVKPTRGVCAPTSPSPSLSYHLLRSLSLSHCSGPQQGGHLAPTEKLCRYTVKYHLNTPVKNAPVKAPQ